ncbi:MAG: glycerol-3-phosphate acyltransferase [Anaerolineales bacterium]|nr:glycerol-3-phosphate acyltransferase [Anaerolineales bacterium]
MDVVFWAVVGFLLGSIPFSLLVGRMVAHRDIRTVADGNPGGTNALRAGGLKAGLPAILLDLLKGFVPVFFARRYGVAGWELVPVCLAPILGHAFSPFLRFRGGKALAATGGAWLGLVGWWVFPIYALLAVPLTLIQNEDAWAACAGMVALLGYAFLYGEPWMVVFAALNFVLIIWTHRRNLVRTPQLRAWVVALVSRRRV